MLISIQDGKDEYQKVVAHLKNNGYSEQKNIADYWFSNHEECKKIIDSKFPDRNRSHIFELQVRWRSPLGETCVEALKKYIEQLKPQARIELNEFIFNFNDRNYSIKEVVDSFPTSDIERCHDLRGVPLDGITLTDCILIDINFSNASFIGAKFERVQLINCNFISANFDNSKFVAVRHEQETQLGGISLRGAFMNALCLSDEVINSRLRFKEIGYTELIKYILKTLIWKKTSLTSSVKWTRFQSVDVRRVNDPVLRYQAEYIRWLQSLLNKIDRFYELSLYDRICFIVSVVFTKYWHSPSVLAIYCVLSNLLFTALYMAPFSHFKNLSGDCLKGWSDDWLESFYFSVVTFTTLGYGDITPCNNVGRIIVILELLVGYISLGGFVIIWGQKISQRY